MNRYIQLSIVALFFALYHGPVLSGNSFIASKADRSLLLDIHHYGNDSAIAVGERGHLLLYRNGEWQQQQLPTQSTLNRVSASGTTIWSVGHDATIVRGTKDSDWQLVYQDKESEKPLFDVHFFDEQHGLAIGAYGLVLRTRDGGENWHKELHASLLLPEDIEYLQEIRAESEEDYQYELEGILPHLNSLLISSTGELWVVGEMGLIAISKDMGESWKRLDEIYNGSFFTALQTDQGRLLVGGLRGNLFYSDDGTNWQRSIIEGTANINGLLQLASGEIIALCNNAEWQISADGGKQFSRQKLSKATLAVAGIELNNRLIVVGDKGLQQLDLDNEQEQ